MGGACCCCSDDVDASVEEEACVNFILYCCWYAAFKTDARFAPGPVSDPIGPTALLDTVDIVCECERV